MQVRKGLERYLVEEHGYLGCKDFCGMESQDTDRKRVKNELQKSKWKKSGVPEKVP